MNQKGGAESLEVEDDPAFQERWWRVERIGWAMMAVLILAALAGLTGGGGVLSRGHAQTGGARIDYPRIARWQAAEQATITFPAGASGQQDVHLSRAFLNAFGVDSITPQPSAEVSTPEGHRLTFDLAAGVGSKTVTLNLRPSRPAFPTEVTARVGQAAPAQLSFVILP